ncbi:MAG: hypothetical protein IKL85_06725 [Lentisphaeria bacterium]|nr:hypothetical protein [Lentisphaeria bacterium]
MPRFLQVLFAAFSFGTRFHGPVKPAEPAMYSRALAFQPFLGLLTGAVAAIPTLFVSASFRGLQGFILLASGIYVFLLEWLTRFDNLHAFDAACRMLAGAGVSPEERLRRAAQPGSSPCTALLVGLKLLVMYLIFMRTALFGDNMMLALTLVAVPFFGRIAMLFAYPSGAGRERPEVYDVIRLGWVVVAMLLLAFALGMIRTYGGDFFSFRSMKLTMSGFRSRTGDATGFSPVLTVVSLGIQDAVTFLASGFLSVLYWNTEASKKLRVSPPPEFAGAVCETAEFGAMIVFLILADDVIF